MADRDIIANLTPRVDAFLGLFDLFEPWEAPEVVDGRAVLDFRGMVGLQIDADEIAPKLRGIDADVLEVHIDSVGGNVWHGVALANALRMHSARVEVEVVAMAASAASIIAMAGDSIRVHPGAMLMVHNGRAFADSVTAEELRATAELLDKINVNMAQIYSARAGGSVAGWLEVMAAETWFTGEEAVAAGLADEVVSTDSVSEGAGEGRETASVDLTDALGYSYNGRVDAPAPDLAIAKTTDTDADAAPDGVRVWSTWDYTDDTDADDPDPDPDPSGIAEALFGLMAPDPSTLAAALFPTPDIDDPDTAALAEAILGKAP